MSSPWDPRLVLSIIGLAADLAILAVLYFSLPGTAKTGHARYVLRFAIVWVFGDVGVQWSIAQGYQDSLLMIVCEVVALIGLAAIPALITHLAWLTTFELKDHAQKTVLERYQLAVYIISMAFIGVAFMLRNGFDLRSQTFIVLFNAWTMGCLAWSVVRFTGPGYEGAPAIERRSRAMLAAGAGTLFFLTLIDLLQTLTGMADLALFSGLQFIGMALMGCGFLVKAKFIVAPARSAASKMAAGAGRHLMPGKLYIAIGEGPDSGTFSIDLLRGQSRLGKPALIISDREPEFYRKRKALENVPAARFVSESWDGPEGIDIMEEDELSMIPWMASEFAFESWELDKETDKNTGSTVIIDDAHVLSKVAGKDATKTFLKALVAAVKDSDQLRIVVVADRNALGKRAKMFEKHGTPLEMSH